MSVNYTISGGGTIMTFNDGVTEITQADVLTYTSIGDITTIVIPTSVVDICGTYAGIVEEFPFSYFGTDGAFSQIRNLTTITFNTPSSLKVIGPGAFYGDDGITSFTLPSGLEYVGNFAINVTSGTPTINTVPSSVRYIGESAFQSYATFTSLTTLPPAIAQISTSAFAFVTMATTLTIPGTVNTIGAQAFGSTIFSGGSGSNCGLILSKGLKTIVGYAFFSASFTGNRTLIIPPSTQSIGDSAFTGGSNLTNITYTSTTALGTNPFPPGVTLTILPGPEPPTDISGIWGPSSIELRWATPAQTGATPADYYLITDIGSTTVYQTPNSNTNYTISGTNPNTIYTYTIQTVNEDEAISAASSSIRVGPPPDPPTDLSATPTFGALILNWTAPAQIRGGTITNYNIIDKSTLVSITTPNNNTTYTITGLTGNVLYTYVLQTITNLGTSADSSDVSGIPLFSNPDPPTDLSGIWNPSSIDLLWTAPIQTGATPVAYYLIKDTSSNTIYQTPNSNTNYTVIGTDPNAIYNYTIQTVNQSDISSNPSTSIRVGRPPDPPTDLSATPILGGLILNWTAPTQTGAGSITNYNIINKSTLVSITTPNATTTYTITGLLGNTLYTYVLQTVTNIGTSTDSSDVSGIPDFSNPDPPTDLSGIWNLTDVVLSWTAPVQTGETPISYYIITNTITTTVYQTPDSTPTYTISHPTDVRYYTYTIQTVNQSSAISVASAPLTIGINRPDPPSNVVATAGYYVVNLTWSAPSYSGTSDISYYIITDVNSFATYNTSNTIYNVPGTPGTPYTYTVKAVNQGGYMSDTSGSVSGTPVTTRYTVVNTTMTFNNGVTEILREDIENYPYIADVLTVIIPTSVVTICGSFAEYQGIPYTTGAFKDLPNLTTITINTPSSLKVIGVAAFSGDSGITSLTLPPGLEYIGDYAINVGSGTPTINTIPSSVIYIGNYAFQGNSTITNLTTLPSAITQILQYAFNYVTISTALTIPGTVTTIGLNSFNTAIFNGGSGTDCGLILSKGLRTISNYAFLSATFSGNRSLVIPPSTQSIGNEAFLYSNLTNITYTSTTTLGTTPFPPGATLTILTGPDPPTNFSGSRYLSFIDLSWTAPTQTGATPIAYYLITDTGNSTVYQTPNNNTLYTISGTNPNNSNTYTIKSVNQDEATSAASTPLLVGPSVPNPPTDLSGIWGPSSIDLLWTAPIQTGSAPIDYYLITDTSNSIIYQTPNANTNYTVTGTNPIVIYFYTIQTVNQDSITSVPSASLRVGPPPNPPTNLSATPTLGGLILNWTAPTQTGGGTITNYNIINKSTLVSITTPNATPSYTITGLSGDILYTYVLQTVTNFGTSADSSDVSGIPDYPIPDAPTNFSGIWNPTDVVLSWTPPIQTGSAPVDYYIITNTITTTVYQTPDSTPTYTISHPTNVNYYTYTIQTVNQNSIVSDPSAPLFVGGNTPEPPTNIVATGGYYVVNLTWSAPSYSGTSDISYYIITDVNSFATYNTSNTIYNVPGTVGTPYTYTVKAVNQGNYISDASGSVTGTPNDTLYTISGDGLAMIFNNGVTEITQADVRSYGGYTSLETVVIPTSVVTICGTLFDDSTFITDGAFSGILGLRTFTINTPSSLQVIGKGAFLNDSIASLTLPSGLQSIGEWAFYNGYVFPGLTMTVNTIPPTVTYIGRDAFNSPVINFSIFANLVSFSSQLTQISANSFNQVTFNGGSGSNCGITFVKGLKTISANAFSNAIFSGNLSLVIPPSTILIGDNAFNYSNLTNITYTSTTALGTTPFPSGATITILPGPEPPTDLSGVWNPSSIDLLWTAPIQTGATPVAYYLITDIESSVIYQTPNANTNYTITGTSPNTIYTYVIQTVNEDDATSADSTTIRVEPPLDPPTDLSAIPTYGGLILNWTAPTQTGAGTITNYNIIDKSTLVSITTPNNNTTYTITGLSGDVLYTYVLQTVTNLGTSRDSSDVSGIALYPRPDPPTDLSGTWNPSSIQLFWTAPIQTGQTPVAYYFITDVSSGTIYQTPNANTNFTITGTTSNIVYTYTIKTMNQSDVSSNPSTSFRVGSPPNPPTNPSATPSNGSLILNWTAPIYTGTGTITNYNIINQSTLVTITTPNTTPSYTITDLSEGIVYIYAIQTVTTNGISTDSSDVSGIPLSPIPDPPTNLTVTGYYGGGGLLVLYWTAPINTGGGTITNYRITDTSTQISITTPNAFPGYGIYVPYAKVYTYVVQTITNLGISIDSSSASGFPEATPIDITVNPQVLSLYFTWNTATAIEPGTPNVQYIFEDINTGDIYRYPPSPSTDPDKAFVITNLDVRLYQFRISTYIGGYISLPSLVVFSVPDQLLYPSNIQLTAGIESIFIDWDSAAFRDISSEPILYIIRDITNNTTYTTYNTFYNFTNLTPYVRYQYTISSSIYGQISTPSPVISGTPIWYPPVAPTDFSGIGISPTAINLFWTPPVDTLYIAFYVIRYTMIDISDISGTIYVPLPNVSTTVNGLQYDQEYAFNIASQDTSGTISLPSPTIYVFTTPRIQTTVTIDGIFKQYLLPMAQSFPLQVITNPPGANTIGPIYIDQYDVSSTTLPILISMQSSQVYTVYAYIDPNDPTYVGSNSPFYTLELIPFLPEPLNCSPALELNALSKGGNFSSAITNALANQMNNTTIAAKVFAQTSAPVCCSTSPIISPFSGGTTSGTQTQALIQNQALCTYNQNLAVAKLRQIPGCPIDNSQRFAKYQRFPSAEANCMPPVIVTGLPKALNGPCTNVIGISQTKPPS